MHIAFADNSKNLSKMHYFKDFFFYYICYILQTEKLHIESISNEMTFLNICSGLQTLAKINIYELLRTSDASQTIY